MVVLSCDVRCATSCVKSFGCCSFFCRRVVKCNGSDTTRGVRAGGWGRVCAEAGPALVLVTVFGTFAVIAVESFVPAPPAFDCLLVPVFATVLAAAALRIAVAFVIPLFVSW